MVRPLALAGPIFVLVVALPLLRPLQHPSESQVSNDEMLRLATIRALVEHRSLVLDRGHAGIPGAWTLRTGVYSTQPPMMAVLLSAPAWLMTQMGLTFEENHLLIAYLLTVLGVTLPVAASAGLIYRMGRLFELRRPWRTAMAIAVVTGSGMLSYAVVLNAYAPAAALVLASAACLIHVSAMNRDDRRAGWFALAGACSALAATLAPTAIVFTILFVFVIPSMRFSLGRRLAGVMLYVLGIVPVFALHAAWNIPVTEDAIPLSVHLALRSRPAAAPPITAVPEFDDELASPPMWSSVGRTLMWFVNGTIGQHGLFSHFPVVILGIIGIGAVMHRHWPSSTKTLAGATAMGAILVVLLCRIGRLEWSNAMFAAQWFVIFTPMLLFWGGAWLRRSHRRGSWVVAGIAVGFSMIVGLIGATQPTPRHGFDHYTVRHALMRLIRVDSAPPDSALAGREL